MPERVDFQKVLSEVDLVLLIASYGYELNEKKSRPHKGEFFLKKEGQESLIVYKKNRSLNNPQVYVTLNNTDDRGNVFNFLFNKGHVPCGNYKEAVNRIRAFDPSSVSLAVDTSVKSHKQKEFSPVAHRAYSKSSYLIAEGIAEKVLQDPLFEGRIFSDSKKFKGVENVVYPAYLGGKLAAQLVRNKGFSVLREGSDKKAFWHSNLQPQTNCSLLFEDPKDALAHYALHKARFSKKGIHPCYIATFGSASAEQLNNVFSFFKKQKDNSYFILAGDNDPAGAKFNLQAIVVAIDQLTAYTKPAVRINQPENRLKLEFTDLPYRLKFALQNRPEFSGSWDQETKRYTLQTDLKNTRALTSLLRDTYEMKRIRTVRSRAKDFHMDLTDSLKADLPRRNKGFKQSR